MTRRKAKRKEENKFASGFFVVASIFLLVLFLKNSTLAADEVRRALEICAKMLIPSLFPLTVLSEIITETGVLERLTRRLSSLLYRILGVSKNAAAPYFLGVLGGYTASCKSAILLYRSGKISKEDCEDVIALSGMPSLAFLTGFVGVGVLGSAAKGWKLWGCAILSTFIAAAFKKLIFKRVPSAEGIIPKTELQQKKYSRIFVDAIAHSANAMLIICANVVFFSVLIGVLEPILISFGFDEMFCRILLGAFEITRGVGFCADVRNKLFGMVLCAFFIGWSGLCVHFQIISLSDCEHLSFKRYFLLKLLQGLICAVLSWAVF